MKKTALGVSMILACLQPLQLRIHVRRVDRRMGLWLHHEGLRAVDSVPIGMESRHVRGRSCRPAAFVPERRPL